MAQVHITDAEAARDLHALLERVQSGVEVVIEKDQHPVAVLTTARFQGRSIDECIAFLHARGSNAVPDEEFAKDVLEAINAHREPMNPPAWD